MRYLLVGFVIVVTATVSGFIGYKVAAWSYGGEIARIAAVNVERLTRVRNAVQSSEVRDLVDVGLSQHLLYMEHFEQNATSDAAYERQRKRAVSLVKREWVEIPPFAIEDETRAFVQKICAETEGCPSGEIKTRRPAESETTK